MPRKSLNLRGSMPNQALFFNRLSERLGLKRPFCSPAPGLLGRGRGGRLHGRRLSSRSSHFGGCHGSACGRGFSRCGGRGGFHGNSRSRSGLFRGRSRGGRGSGLFGLAASGQSQGCGQSDNERFHVKVQFKGMRFDERYHRALG